MGFFFAELTRYFLDNSIKNNKPRKLIRTLGRLSKYLTYQTTNIFSYTLASAGAKTSGASTANSTSASCQNVATSFFGQVCSTWAGTTADYEGITLDFLFIEDRSSFTGTTDAIEQSGSGLTANTTTVSFIIAGTSPVPAAAWLFGSALIGLVGVKRKK